jgi:multiple sugar transport system substrate-binding protein
MEHQKNDAMMRDLEREMMKRGYSRRDFVKIASALGVSGLLAACGGSVKPQTDAGKSAAGTPTQASKSLYDINDANGLQWPKTAVAEPTSKVQLSIAHAWDAPFWTRQQQFDELFMKRHPNITISAENTQWADFLQKYVAQAAGGTLPDVMYCHFSWIQQFVTQGSMLALDDYIAKQPDFNIDDFTKPSLGFYKRGGKLYGVAYDCGPGLLFYNKDMFDKAGVKYPTADWTLDDLKAAAIKMVGGSGASKTFGYIGTPTPNDSTIAPAYLYPFGGQYVNEPAETECLINKPEAVKAMEWWMELRLKYNAVPSPGEQQAMTAQQTDAFTLGRCAMMINGSWATPALSQNANFKWDIAPWPKGPVKHSTFAAGSAYTIAKSSKYPDAAWIYLNEYLSTAGQSFMWGMTGRGSPARSSAWDSYFKSKYAPANARVVLDSLNTFASNEILFQPTTPKVTNTAKAIWDRVDAGQLPVKDALDQLVQQLNPILAANK